MLSWIGKKTAYRPLPYRPYNRVLPIRPKADEKRPFITIQPTAAITINAAATPLSGSSNIHSETIPYFKRKYWITPINTANAHLIKFPWSPFLRLQTSLHRNVCRFSEFGQCQIKTAFDDK